MTGAPHPPPTATGDIRLAPMTAAHAGAVLAIYEAGIATGDATFDTEAPTWTAFDAGKLPAYRYVASTADGQVVGWIACAPVSARPVYAGVVEHSVYVDPAHGGRGVGRALLTRLIEATEAAGIWTIQAGIFPENAASIALHHRCGFRTVGIRERMGCQQGRWRDVVLLERRSPRVGGH